MSGITSIPKSVLVSVRERLTFAYDFTNYLARDETVTAAAGYLVNRFTGGDASPALSNVVPGSVVIPSSPIVTLTLAGSELTPNMDYLLTVTVTTNTGDVNAMETVVCARA